MTEERRFFATLRAVPIDTIDVSSELMRLDDWLAALQRDLTAGIPDRTGLHEGGPLAARIEAIEHGIAADRAAWARQWAELRPAQALADRFDDRAMLLVFGKLNAGKSSLCNFIAERCAMLGGSARSFGVEGGRVIDRGTIAAAGGLLKEGATETTSRLQGVILDERLVLLDTPGLHSVTDENAALTRRFTDSADGMLWLTSSASPGQVQELDELTRELRRDKPLLPVVTRSDVIEEDEIDGDIRKCLRNKTAPNRRMQEDDVRARARARLSRMGVDPELLREPVSISVAAAREQGLTAAAMADAGFERLYAALTDLIRPALAYKQRKPAAVRLHHLRENVLGSLENGTGPRLAQLAATLEDEQQRLAELPAVIAQSVWRALVPKLPPWLDEYERADQPDIGSLQRRVSQAFDEALNEALRQHLAQDYQIGDTIDRACVDGDAVGQHTIDRLDNSRRLGEPRDLDAPATDRTPITVSLGRLDGLGTDASRHEQRYLALEASIQHALQRLAPLIAPHQATVSRLQVRVADMQRTLRSAHDSLDRYRRELSPSMHEAAS
ncbi:MAG: 50S ribosome-binding GTPase [Burkholderiaceae bacterium]